MWSQVSKLLPALLTGMGLATVVTLIFLLSGYHNVVPFVRCLLILELLVPVLLQVMLSSGVPV